MRGDVLVFVARSDSRHILFYEIMNRRLRGRIFDRMMNFARRVDFKYHCVDVDKRYVTSVLQIATRLKRSLEDFLAQKKDALADVEKVKVYYERQLQNPASADARDARPYHVGQNW